MNKFFVKAGFSKLKDSELVLKANTIIGALRGNENFLDPNPSLPVVTAAVEEFQDRLTILPSAKRIDTVLKNESRTQLLGLLKRLGYYVNETAEDFVALFTSGFPVSEFPFKKNSEVPAIPNGLKLSDSTHSGKMRLDFNPVKDARVYMYRHAATTEGVLQWEDSLPTTSSRNNVIDGVKPGTEYQVQVKSVNSAGFSDWSDSARLIAR